MNDLFAYNNAGYQQQNPPQAFQSYYDDYTLGGSLEFGTKVMSLYVVSAVDGYQAVYVLP